MMMDVETVLDSHAHGGIRSMRAGEEEEELRGMRVGNRGEERWHGMVGLTRRARYV